MSRMSLMIAAVALSSLTGCESFGTGRSMSLWKQKSPDRSPLIGENEEIRSDRDYLRVQGRGGSRLEAENDPLKKYIHSQTALDIERNLGIGE